jgi:hypothetical protein
MIEIKKYKGFDKVVFVCGKIVLCQNAESAEIIDGNVVFTVLDDNTKRWYFDLIPYLVSNELIREETDSQFNLRRIELDGKYLKT